MIRRCTLALVCVAALGSAALAAGPVDRILDDLSRLGYGQVTVERTLLGRTRIVASNKDTEREIILDPRTGEILRDLWISNDNRSSGGGLVGGGQSGAGSGTGSGSGPSGDVDDDDDDDDDDDNDDDDDDDDGDDDDRDNSGPGGGNGDDGDDGDD